MRLSGHFQPESRTSAGVLLIYAGMDGVIVAAAPPVIFAVAAPSSRHAASAKIVRFFTSLVLPKQQSTIAVPAPNLLGVSKCLTD
jgi:hypothetical protein